MYTETEIMVDTKQSGIESAVVYSNFDEALEALTGKDYEIISLPKNAQLRIQRGKDSNISRNGNWTREGVIYHPKEKPKLVRNSPILLWGANAIRAHKDEDEFYPTRWQSEQALQDSIEFPQNNIEIPTDRFASDKLAVYLFGGEDEAKNYGEFLMDEGIHSMPIHTLPEEYVKSQKWPFLRQLWFLNLDARSGIGSCDKLLTINKGIGLRGIKNSE